MLRKYIEVYKTGSLNNLKLSEGEIGEPGDDEVMVEIKAIGLNYADIFCVLGLYKAAPKNQSFIPGLEFSGEIIKVGKNVKTVSKGDKVMGVTKFGAYVTHINIDQKYVMPLPEGWTMEEGAAFPVQVLTAYYALVTLGNLQKGQSVLIHSAAGGVGLLANRIAKKFGAYTIGVVGNQEKVSLLQREKYDAGIVRSDDFKKDVITALDGRELNLVLETTGGKYFKMSYDIMAPQGRLIAYGSAQYTPSGNKPNYFSLIWKFLSRPKIDPHAMITQNKSIMAFNLIWIYEKAELMRELMQDIQSLHLEPPVIGHIYKFEEIPEALKTFKGGKTMGKLVVKVAS